MEFLLFLLAFAGGIVSLVLRAKIRKLERRVVELSTMTERHAAAGTVLYERIEALRLRAEVDEARIAAVASTAVAGPAPVIAGSAAPASSETTSPSPETSPVAIAPTDITSPAAPVGAADPTNLAARAASPPEVGPGAAQTSSLETGARSPDLSPTPSAAPATEAGTPPAIAERGPETRTAEPVVSPPAETAAPEPPAPPLSEGSPATPESAPTPPAARAFDWESLVGVRLFSWVAGLAFVLAAVFFLRYSIDQGLLGPPIRMAIGIAAGTALLVVSETRGRSRWNVTANALGAAGIAILFATFFAADALWHLLPQLATFGLMVLVTAVAVLLAVRHDSVFIALLGLVGGFATPILLSTGDDRPIGLFAYLAVLNVGLAWVGRRRRWTVLIALSVGFTALYQWGWVAKFLLDKPQELPIAVGVFLLFPVVVAASRMVPPRADAVEATAGDDGFETTVMVSAGLPLLFALCFAWVPALGDHYVLLFAYLFLLDVGLAIVAVATRRVLLHGASALATALVFAGWMATSYGHHAWPFVLGFVALFVLLFLLAPFGGRWLQVRLARDPRPHVELTPVRLAGPLLLFPIPVLIFLEPAAASPWTAFGVLFLLLVAVAAVALAEAAGSLHFLAAFFAVVAEGVWSARYLSPQRLHEGLLIYGAFGLLHLCVPLVAKRLRKPLDPAWSAPALLVASLALLLFLAAGPVAHVALWGMAILLAILNLGLFFDRRPGRVSWLAGLGMMLSWVVIAVWWATAMEAALLLPALAIVAGFATLLVGGNLWADQQLGAQAGGASRNGTYLGLVGHLFLLFVASQSALAAPPWPLFGVLFVLDLAILVGALFARQATLQIATVAASQLVVAVWVVTTRRLASSTLSWPEVGLVAAVGIAGLGLLALPLAVRRGANVAGFRVGAAAGLLGLQVVVAVAEATAAPPAVGWLVVVPALGLVALGWLACEMGALWLMLAALVPYAVGTAAWIGNATPWRTEHSVEILGVAGIPYALWLAYPVWLGSRGATTARQPFIAAVLASGLFFLFGHHAMAVGGFTPYIGVLPVMQALLLVGLLAYLLKLEPSSARDQGRLAVVAGAALAFVTVAIPLQLDKQWITIGWSLEAAALAWLYRRIPHKGLLATAAGLSAAVVLRLSLNKAVLSYHPRGALPIWNWYLYAYLVSALALLAGGAILAGADDGFVRAPKLPRVSSQMRAGATLLLFLLVNIEIADYWSSGSEITFNFSSGIAQDLTYTLGWAIFAIALLAVGIARQSRAARLTALLLLVLTAAKAFLHDLWRLGGLYRVGSFVGLAMSLALVAVILQRFVLPPPPTKKAS